MKNKFVLLLCCSLCFILGSYSSIYSKADPGLQSTGRIITNNPETGLQEVIFDASDQEKLKDDINSNAVEISDIKTWMQDQEDINKKVEEDITELNDNLVAVDISNQINVTNSNFKVTQAYRIGNIGYITIALLEGYSISRTGATLATINVPVIMLNSSTRASSYNDDVLIHTYVSNNTNFFAFRDGGSTTATKLNCNHYCCYTVLFDN